MANLSQDKGYYKDVILKSTPDLIGSSLVTVERLYPSDISESVMRKALYWFSELADWTLSQHLADNRWVVQIRVDSETECFALWSALDRHVNDFVLRDTIDRRTSHGRENVIRAALESFN